MLTGGLISVDTVNLDQRERTMRKCTHGCEGTFLGKFHVTTSAEAWDAGGISKGMYSELNGQLRAFSISRIRKSRQTCPQDVHGSNLAASIEGSEVELQY